MIIINQRSSARILATREPFVNSCHRSLKSFIRHYMKNHISEAFNLWLLFRKKDVFGQGSQIFFRKMAAFFLICSGHVSSHRRRVPSRVESFHANNSSQVELFFTLTRVFPTLLIRRYRFSTQLTAVYQPRPKALSCLEKVTQILVGYQSYKR